MNAQSPTNSLQFLNDLETKREKSLKSFNHYAEQPGQGKKPKEHFCVACKAFYKQYNEDQRKMEPTWKDIFPNCKGSLEEMEISKQDWLQLGGSNDEYEVLEIENNPIKWAAAELGFITRGIDYDRDGDKVSMDRWYQEQMLACSSLLKVYRAGRRIGKCLEEGTEVMTPLGPVAIEKLVPGDTVYGYDPDTDTTFETPVISLFDQGIKDVVDLTRSNKSIVGTTIEHRFHTVTERGQKKVRKVNELYKGCSITRKFVKVPMGKIHEPQAYALGALLGDGCSVEAGSAIKISSADEPVVKAVKESLGGNYYWKNSGNNFTWVISNYEPGHNSTSYKNKQITSPLYDAWVKGRYAHQKTVDIEVLKSWDRESCLAFLAGLLDTDGSVQVVNGKELFISVDSQAEGIINAVVFLLKALFQKTPSVITDKRDKYVNGPVKSVRMKNNLHCSRILKELNPYIKCERKSWKPEYDNLVQNNENEDFLGVQVDKSKTRKARCWDIEIGTKDHLFLLGNGMVSHNSETMAVEVLYELSKNNDFHVVLVAPFETQLLKFEQKLIGYIEQSQTVKDKFLKYNKTKHVITFGNGSQYEGYCTGGDKQSKTADRVRGAGASMLVLDEADYISEDALQAVLAVMSDDPKCRILLSSTPSGKRGFFYQWITDKSIGFKEFHIYSHASPSYTRTADNLYRATLSEDKYKKEYLGEFGTLIQALIRPEDINKATEQYDMARLRTAGPNKSWRYIVGVDWNGRKIGTNIVVIGYDPSTDKYKMVDKVLVRDTEFNYENSCWAAINSFKHWNAEYMYVDAGHGDMQVEMMKKTASMTSDLRLMKGIVPVAMGGFQVIKDPVSGEDVKKPTKEFAINLMVNIFEQGRVIIPYSENYKEDDEDWGLIPQLYDLAIDSFSDGGKPKYVKSVDHTMAAFYIAVLGFYMKMTDIAKFAHDSTSIVESKGNLKKLAGNITIAGMAEREKMNRDKIQPGQFVARSELTRNPAQGPSYGVHTTVNADNVEWTNGVPMYKKHDSSIASVPMRNMGVIHRGKF